MSGRHGFSDRIFRDVFVHPGFSRCFVCHRFSSHCDEFLTEFVAHFSGLGCFLPAFRFMPWCYFLISSFPIYCIMNGPFSRTASAENVLDCILLHYLNGLYVAMTSTSLIVN